MFDVVLSLSTMSRPLTTRLLWAATLAFWGFIFVMTHIPQQRLPGVRVNDKTAHLISYGVLAAMLYVTLWVSRPHDWSPLWKIPLVLALYAAFDELTQPLVNRFAEFADWYADVAGAVIVVAALSLIRAIVSTLRHRETEKQPG
jgi:VanZ family protein